MKVRVWRGQARPSPWRPGLATSKSLPSRRVRHTVDIWRITSCYGGFRPNQ